MMDYNTNDLKLCACLGPQFNEPFCPCMMKSKNLPSSQERLDYYENLGPNYQQKLDMIFNDIFNR